MVSGQFGSLYKFSKIPQNICGGLLMKKVLFISSTGGHLSELLKLEPLFKNYNFNIITEKDKSTETLINKYHDKVSYLPYCTRSKLFSYIFVYTYLIFKSLYLFLKIKLDNNYRNTYSSTNVLHRKII